MFLVERLETLLANAKKLPLSSNVVVDQATALDLIDQLRVAVPEEIRAARRISTEGERIIDRAREEGDEVVSRAREDAADLLSEQGLTRLAEDESRRIIAEAQAEADEIRRGADDYAASVLESLDHDLSKTIQTVRRGLDTLDARRSGRPEVGGLVDRSVSDDLDEGEREGAAPPSRK